MINARKLLLLPLAALALLASGCGEFANTESAEVGCVFNGGPLDSKDFREYTAPGAGRDRVGWGSNVIEVPLRLITYEISLDAGRGDTPTADSLPVNVGGMKMQFEPTVAMRFNTTIEEINGKDKPKVCEFVEVHLRPLDSTDFNEPEGTWRYVWLKERFRPWVDVAGVRVLQEYNDPIAMYFNTDGYRDEAAEKLGPEITKELRAALGDDYFCGPHHEWGDEECGDVRVTLPQPKVSQEDEDILKAPQRARTQANARVATAEEETRAAVAEANEEANRAEDVASARARVASAATKKADADEKIAEQEARTKRVEAANDYLWCERLIELGQSCWLVKGAETGSLPQVMGDVPDDIVVTVPVVE